VQAPGPCGGSSPLPVFCGAGRRRNPIGIADRCNEAHSFRKSISPMAKSTTATPVSADQADAAATAGQPPASFEAAMAELESIVEQMEDGRLALDASLAAYRRGVELTRYCRDALADAGQKVRILEADLLTPFEPDPEPDE
jgi:exodeoxyribonuclease VII small subunit